MSDKKGNSTKLTFYQYESLIDRKRSDKLLDSLPARPATKEEIAHWAEQWANDVVIHLGINYKP